MGPCMLFPREGESTCAGVYYAKHEPGYWATADETRAKRVRAVAEKRIVVV